MQVGHHPLFARFYGWMAPLAEKAGTGEHRAELLSGLEGRVVEVGAGSGLNFAHYPATVDEVVAVEPDAHLRRLARRAAAAAPVPVRVVAGVAEDLPGGDAAYDAGVASLVLCSVGDQVRALGELRRVIRRGGELRFYEHVRSASARRARLQDRLQRVWSICGGGCHPNRETEAAIVAAGFHVASCRRFDFAPSVLCAPVAPIILGRAVRDGQEERESDG